MKSEKAVDTQYVKSRLLALIDNLSDKSLLLLLKNAEQLPLKGNRKELRKVCFIKINITTPDDRLNGTAHDISYSGIFVENSRPMALGREISLSFTAPGMAGPIEIKGEVVRMNPRGIGIQFKDMTEEQERGIKKLVDSI
ncbi:MAG: PilZ domain-containing protein [Pseudomonadota bacterium]